MSEVGNTGKFILHVSSVYLLGTVLLYYTETEAIAQSKKEVMKTKVT